MILSKRFCVHMLDFREVAFNSLESAIKRSLDSREVSWSCCYWWFPNVIIANIDPRGWPLTSPTLRFSMCYLRTSAAKVHYGQSTQNVNTGLSLYSAHIHVRYTSISVK